MAAIRVCGRCGYANTEAAASCQQCGVSLQPLPPTAQGAALLGIRAVLLNLMWIELPFALVGMVFSAIVRSDLSPSDYVRAFMVSWIFAMLVALFWLWLFRILFRQWATPPRWVQYAGLVGIGFITPFFIAFPLALVIFVSI